MKKHPQVIFLELNEFNISLLEIAASKLKLINIQKMLQLHRSQTTTEDTYESDFLEPWVQWVSIHTGKPSKLHQIKHLGDVPGLKMRQLWQELSDHGISSGIWVAMNASRAGAKECRFFIPDPWTASEKAYPEELNELLEPLRYNAKNYTSRSAKELALSALRLFKYMGRHKMILPILKELPALCKNLIRFKAHAFVFISLFDFLSTKLFLKYREKYSPDFSLIFLNSLAHLQHHHWDKNSISGPLVYGLSYLDRAIGLLLEAPHDLFLVTNALSQKNTNEEKPWILYRQFDQMTFLKAINLHPTSVESHMTHDAHIFFANKDDLERAKKTLSEASVNDSPLFLVESYQDEPLKLFYRIVFTDELPKEASFIAEGKSYPFYDYFKAIVRRTGKHIPYGTLLSSQPIAPSSLNNHDIYNLLLTYYTQRT